MGDGGEAVHSKTGPCLSGERGRGRACGGYDRGVGNEKRTAGEVRRIKRAKETL